MMASLLACALAATWSMGLYAQEQGEQQSAPPSVQQGERMGRRGPMSPQMELDRLTKELNLTSDQQDKIKPILEDQQKQMQDLRNDTSVEGQDRFVKMREIRKSHMDQIRDILTSDQQTKFDEMQKRMMERRRGPGGEGGGNPPPPQL
jgi:Spy/CpxP family protein refolding chaperone